jgi:Effector-associated domain 11
MENEKYTLLNIRLSPESAEKLFEAVALGKLEGQNVFDFVFESTDTVEKTPTLPVKNEILISLQKQIKQLLMSDLEETMRTFLGRLNEESECYDKTILFISKYKRVKQSQMQGLITFQEAELEITRIENGIIYLVNELKMSELNSNI